VCVCVCVVFVLLVEPNRNEVAFYPIGNDLI